jgi:hypothetical protein
MTVNFFVDGDKGKFMSIKRDEQNQSQESEKSFSFYGEFVCFLKREG